MGTRNLTVVIKDNSIKLSQYGQFDGYFSYTGVKFLDFCRENLGGEWQIEDFKKKIDLLNEIDTITESLMNKTVEQLNTQFYKVPLEQLFPQFHRNTGVEILNIINDLKTYNFDDEQKFPIHIDYDTSWVEYINIIDLDKNKVYMLRLANDNFISIPTTQLIENEYIQKGFECYLSYKLNKIPSKNIVFKHYNKVEV